MKIKTAELTGAALDWAVAKCEGVEVEYINDGITRCLLRLTPFTGRYAPSTGWAQGGPIIEREVICILPHASGGWLAKVHGVATRHEEGQTPLIAAMRCYVASKLGEDVDVPKELAP